MRFKLLLIFVVALILRFLYFPNNVYFGYDQARDSYTSLEVLKGNIKLVGPPSSVDDRIFHGPLIYYIYAPIYLIASLNPEAVSFVFRIINALGIFLIFTIATILFNKKTGLIAALLFAISYEQTQYSLFLSHPSLAAITVLIYYLGLALAIFRKNANGLILASLGLGLSIQFHYVNLSLLVGLTFYLFIYRKEIFYFKRRVFFYSLFILLLTISSFIIAEIKFDFRSTQAFFENFINTFTFKTQTTSSTSLSYIFNRFIHDNFISWSKNVAALFSLLISIPLIFFLNKKDLRPKLTFLMIWFINGLVTYFYSHSSSYYHSPSSSISLLIFVALLIYLAFEKYLIVSLAGIILIIFSNFSLIFSLNNKGPNSDIVIQPQMLTIYEKQTLDYCYQHANGKSFSVNALTVPLYITTTWSYIFQWYGLSKYYYVPIWGGAIADGFYNNLPVQPKRSLLPKQQCLIIEPTVGIAEYDKNNFLREENYFSKIIEEKTFGPFVVQYREKY